MENDDPHRHTIGWRELSDREFRRTTDRELSLETDSPAAIPPSAQKPISEQDLGTLPDVRLPSDMLVWRSTLRAGFLVDLPEMNPAFAYALAKQVGAGLTGRGSSRISPGGRLFVSFGVTPAEAETGTVLSEYAAELLRHLALPPDALLSFGINDIEPSADLIEKTDQAIRALGLRALKPLKSD